jgi:hypothetical protein
MSYDWIGIDDISCRIFGLGGVNCI